MNRQSIIGGVVIAAVLLGGIVLFSSGGGDGESPTMAPITGPERAEEARGVIAEIEQAREVAAAAASRTIERPAPAGAQPVDGGAIAVTPAAPAAEPAAAEAALGTAFERAEAFRNTGQLADAQLLYFYAARDGHAGAAFEYAALNDPNHHSPETSLLAEPDAFQAYRWYSAALAGGMTAAQERLDALHQWAVAAAADGDGEADRLLLQWEQ
jgi:hypothetical protein